MSNAEWQGQPVTTPVSTVPSTTTNLAADDRRPLTDPERERLHRLRPRTTYREDLEPLMDDTETTPPAADVGRLVERVVRIARAHDITYPRGHYVGDCDVCVLLAALRQRDERSERLAEQLSRFAVVRKDEYGFCRLCLEQWRPLAGEHERHGDKCLLHGGAE